MAADTEVTAPPPWVGLVVAGTGIVVGIGVAVQRHALWAPHPRMALIALAALPWVLVGLGRPLPKLATALIVIGAVFFLVWRPTSNDFTPFFLILLAGYMAADAPEALSLAVAVAAAGSIVAVELAGRYNGSLIWSAGIFFAWFFGCGFQWQQHLLADLRRAQAGLAEKAATEERQRVAREVHDVIAHSLSVTMLHLTGARLALQSGEREEAIDALAEAERTGRLAMADVRRTVGLLAPAGAGPATSSVPGAADIAEMVAGYRAAGLPVDLDVRGDLGLVSPATGLALYRIAQESLANVAKHAPATPVVVAIAVESGAVRLSARNRMAPSASGDGQGVGLRGMRERAELLGGTFRGGSVEDRWEVEVVVPLGEAGG